jgi:hypothetical protein
MIALIARWPTEDDATLEPPSQVQWQDGTDGTNETDSDT